MRKLNFFLISSMIHLILFSLFFLSVNVFKVPERLGRASEPILSSYIYTSTLHETNKVEKKKTVKKEKIVKHIKEKPLSFPPPIKAFEGEGDRESTISISQHQQTPGGMRQGEEKLTLVALLHDAIQKKQIYPENALAMEREGRVKVKFILYTDGHIGDLHLLSSSGTMSLDNAALNAVREASPFQHLVKYIREVQTYQIDIVFELA